MTLKAHKAEAEALKRQLRSEQDAGRSLREEVTEWKDNANASAAALATLRSQMEAQVS